MASKWLLVRFIFLVVCMILPTIWGRHPRPKYDRTEGCIYQHGYVDGLHSHSQNLQYTAKCELLRGAGGWAEKLPNQYTCYDRLGNVIEKVHIWPTGCWMVIERCNHTDGVCVPGSGQKWKFGGCTWNLSLCVPTKEHWRNGSWVPFGHSVQASAPNWGCTSHNENQNRKRKCQDHDDHTYSLCK